MVQQTVLSFDGKTCHIEVADPFESHTVFTISLWLKPAVVDTGGFHGIMGKNGDLYRKPSLWQGTHRGMLRYDTYGRAGARHGASLTGFFDETPRWVHLAWIKRGFGFEFYRNGELWTVRAAPVTIYTTHRSGYDIGRVDDHYWAGEIADVRVWSCIRSEQQILSDMTHRLKGTEQGLAGYWPLDDGSGAVAKDKSSNGNHGVIQGSISWVTSDLPMLPSLSSPL